MRDALSTWCAVLPCCPSQPSSPICSQGLRAKCQPTLMHTQRTMDTQCWHWRGTAVKSLLREAVSSMTGPLGEGTENNHGNLISSLIPPHPPPPSPNFSEQGAGRGEVGVLKTEQRWQLSLQSWWDKVISLSCCNWWALGWSNFTFLSALSEG